jgi:hypothetical protein
MSKSVIVSTSKQLFGNGSRAPSCRLRSFDQGSCPAPQAPRFAGLVRRAAIPGVIAIAVVFTQPLDVIVGIVVPAILARFRDIIDDAAPLVSVVVPVVVVAILLTDDVADIGASFT